MSDFAPGGCLISELKSDAQLLREYAEKADEAGFREIVVRYTDLVYSAALRQVDSADLARDVAQNVFADLARKAPGLAGKLSENSSLVGWLYRATRFEALDLRREARRRQIRERQAMADLIPNSDETQDWQRLRPVLDEAMSDLSETDRDAVLLRFFKDQGLREVGLALGLNEDAAQKRVTRALDKLRGSLSRRGITTATGALTVLISANAIQSAPVGLALTLAASALAETVIPSSAALVATKAITMTVLQKTLIGAALAAAVGTGVFEAQRIARLRDENRRLLEQNETLAQERDTSLANAAAQRQQLEGLQRDQGDLLRLRGEIAALRRQTNDLDKLKQENRQLQAALAKAARPTQSQEADSDSDPQRQFAIAKMNDAKVLVLGWLMYATEHQDRLPEDLNMTSNYWSHGGQQISGTNQFELVSQGFLQSITNPATTIVIREKDPSYANGKRFKTYGFADGHAEVKTEPPQGFEAWEKQHIISALPNP